MQTSLNTQVNYSTHTIESNSSNEKNSSLQSQEITVNQVGKIIIFSDDDHTSGEVSELIHKTLKIKELKLVNFVSFVESQCVENPMNLSFSLEEWSQDSSKSFGPPLLLAIAHIMMGTLHSSQCYDLLSKNLHYMLSILYVDPYFKSIILKENFKNYNPHTHGLPKQYSKSPYYKMEERELLTLNLIQKHFKELDTLSSDERNNRMDSEIQQLLNTIFSNPKIYNPMALTAWISEYAAVAKTIAIQKVKSAEEKEAGDFSVETLWQLFYQVGIDGNQHGNLFETLNNTTRSHFMSNKVIRKINQFTKNKVSALNFPFVLFTGSAHVPTLLNRLQPYSAQPIEVIKVQDIAHKSIEMIADQIKVS